MAETEFETLKEAVDDALPKILATRENLQGIIAAAHLELDYWRVPSIDPDTGKNLTLAGRIALGMAQGGTYRIAR